MKTMRSNVEWYFDCFITAISVAIVSRFSRDSRASIFNFRPKVCSATYQLTLKWTREAEKAIEKVEKIVVRSFRGRYVSKSAILVSFSVMSVRLWWSAYMVLTHRYRRLQNHHQIRTKHYKICARFVFHEPADRKCRRWTNAIFFRRLPANAKDGDGRRDHNNMMCCTRLRV